MKIMNPESIVTTIEEKLRKFGACREAIAWAESYGEDEAWAKCQRGDWMLWLLGKFAGPPESEGRKKLVLAACDVARLALPHTKDTRVLACIETAERWARGESTIEQLREARADAYAAAYASYYADADADADDAANAAANASYAADTAYAADAAAYAVYAYARPKILAQCADIVRRHYPDPPIA